MKRVMIVGQPGSGKSTLARMLGEVTGLRVVHMDKIHWMSGWVQRDDEGRWALVNETHAREEWIFEGGFSRSWDVRATRADTLIWIDVGVWKRLLRVTWRFIKYFGQARPDLPEGCKEGNWRELIIFYQWIWTTRHSARRRIEAVIETHRAGLDVVVLSTIPEVERYVEAVRAGITRG